jgi:hypothetical protein
LRNPRQFRNDVVNNVINHPPVITTFIDGIQTIKPYGWFMALLYPHDSGLVVIDDSIEWLMMIKW